MGKGTVLLVDMDGVICDLLPSWLHEYGNLSGEWLHLDDIVEYGHERYVSNTELFWEALEMALEVASPMVGSGQFNTLCDNYNTYIVTYAHSAAPGAHRIKLEWLARYFPDFPQDRVIFTKHKHLVRGDILIEDSQDNIQAWLGTEAAGRAFVVKAPYNPEGLTWDQIAEDLL
jgi:5'(3')-deoxyribonucleotidase